MQKEECESSNLKDKICVEKVQGCLHYFVREKQVTEDQGNIIQELCAKHSLSVVMNVE